MSNKIATVIAAAAITHAAMAFADTPILTLDPTADTAPSSPLMMGLDKLGVADPLKSAGLNITGWIDAGYTTDTRNAHHGPVILGPIKYDNTLGPGNHAFLDQFTLRFERTVASDKFDVGGLIEVMYGADTAALHSNGLTLGNETRTGKGGSPFADDRFHPIDQFDITQAYLDINLPLDNGLKLRAGKFYGLLGYESNDPRSTPFYSRSYLFNATPYTMTGITATYSLNDQWEIGESIIRGSDQSLEDNNGAISTVTHILYKPNKQWSFTLNTQVGPENDNDTSHYRVAPDFIATWQANDKLSFALELLYMYDGGRNASAPTTHAYGDVWGAAFYTSYAFNDYATGNLRLENFHDFANDFNVTNPISPGIPTVNVYEITLGLSIKPFPKDPLLKILLFRPETRYDYSEDHIFQAGNNSFRDQWTFAADMIFSF